MRIILCYTKSHYMDKFILLSQKRSGSNNLLNALMTVSGQNMVWFDSPPDIFKKFNLSFDSQIYENDVNECLDELFSKYHGCKINWDEEGFFNVIDTLLNYDVKKIFLYRENIWEKVLSEELALQVNYWTNPIGRHREYKTTYKFDGIDSQIFKKKMIEAKNKYDYVMNQIDNNFIVIKYEDLYSRGKYTEVHKENFIGLLNNININTSRVDDAIGQFLDTHHCYKTENTYKNIANISELENLRDYLSI